MRLCVLEGTFFKGTDIFESLQLLLLKINYPA